ncbi:MAG: hypothetical protein V7774_09070 [Pseudorhizobium pelagicum]|uniref:Uncharacterized protein n=1 Tax=Pseudorhizobium tarimense TaxID=1079109 RepID=A0ABV2H220_9HYPH|nr:hypothetical protein [Pseudorhizobium tarimense]MCJ8517795.1 hypothetical protein [Pseudorhizobium tarimense]
MQFAILFDPEEIRLPFDAHDVKLPLARSPDCLATLVDADGRDVLTLDVNNDRPDADVEALAQLILTIINTSAGLHRASRTFKTERTA